MAMRREKSCSLSLAYYSQKLINCWVTQKEQELYLRKLRDSQKAKNTLRPFKSYSRRCLSQQMDLLLSKELIQLHLRRTPKLSKPKTPKLHPLNLKMLKSKFLLLYKMELTLRELRKAKKYMTYCSLWRELLPLVVCGSLLA